MDAKNLEVLLQLKRAMDEAKAVEEREEKPKAHVPGQGFSEESERIFKELAKKRLGMSSGEAASSKSQSRPIKAEPARTKPKTPWPKAPAGRLNTSKPSAQTELPVEKRASQEPAKWEKRVCRFCKSEYVVNLLWDRIPIMCNGCRTERKNTHYQVPEGETLYTETHVFHGGGPGTGRRK